MNPLGVHKGTLRGPNDWIRFCADNQNRFLAKVGTLSFRSRPCDWVDLQKKRLPPISCHFRQVSLLNCRKWLEIGVDLFFLLEIHPTTAARFKAECPNFGQKSVLKGSPRQWSRCIALVFTLTLQVTKCQPMAGGAGLLSLDRKGCIERKRLRNTALDAARFFLSSINFKVVWCIVFFDPPYYFSGSVWGTALTTKSNFQQLPAFKNQLAHQVLI